MKHIQAHNVGFLTESWNVKKQINEDSQTEMELGDPRQVPAPEPAPVQDSDLMNDKNFIKKVKDMIDEYKTTKNKALLRPIMEEMAKLYAPEAKEIVDKFENDRLKPTRGNYGKYMSLLSSMEGIHRGAMVFALRDAGAGRGLDDALKIISGNY